MVTFAAITFSNSIIGWIVVGLVAGFLAHTVFGAGSGGLISDLIVGLIGALVGGFALGYFYHGTVGIVGSIVVAFIGALILTLILRAFTGRRAHR
jgi:uncharacterized membrane protein YeaQ/YmgE (transglycosylase-associated protein family)